MRPSRAAGLLFGLGSACVLCVADASADVLELRPGEPRWFESRTGKVAELAFDVGADQFVHLELHQWEVDVAVSVLDPTGAVVQQADDVDETSVIETLSWTRSPPGRYRLRIEGKGAIADGRFSVLLDRPRPSAETDAQWLRCERAFASMQRLPAELHRLRVRLAQSTSSRTPSSGTARTRP
jgi:hypothetical protein